MRDELVVEDEQQWRDQHRERHDEQQEVREFRGEDRIGNREGDKHEREFARLRKTETEQPERLPPEAVQPPHHEQHGQFRRDCDGRPKDYVLPDLLSQHEVDACSNRDEEQAEEQALEGVDVAFQLVPVFARGEDDTGHEGAKRGRQADE